MDFSNLKQGIISELFNLLNQNNIRYCHWKSNAFLKKTIEGINDLDLLIHHEDIHKFQEILNSLKFKKAESISNHQIPGVIDFYGYDPSLDWFIHVHAHYQLIFGHDATKNCHLPIENAFLNSSFLNGIIKTPSYEYEFIILVIRMVLKHLTWDSMLRGESHLSENEIIEIEYLNQKISIPSIKKIIETQIPMLEYSVFINCMDSLISRKFGITQLCKGQQLSNNLRVFSRINGWQMFWKKILYRFQDFYRRRILKDPNKKKFSSGGLMIAIIGGDGSGKSTLVDELKSWVGTDFSNYKFHLGKPKWSLMTIIVRSLLKVTRFLHIHPFLKAPIKYTADISQIKFPGYPWAIREICTARDRLITYHKARNYASNGGIVFCDRFPISGINFMECPQIERMCVGIKKNKFLNWLINKEKTFYKYMLPADLMIILKVTPSLAVNRKTDEEPEEVFARSNEIYQFDWSLSNVILLDANKSKEEVLKQAKSLIWSFL
jgi:thymidylate kinase